MLGQVSVRGEGRSKSVGVANYQQSLTAVLDCRVDRSAKQRFGYRPFAGKLQSDDRPGGGLRAHTSQP